MKIQVETLPPEGEWFTVKSGHSELMAQWVVPGEFEYWRFDEVHAEIFLQPDHGGVKLQSRYSGSCVAPCDRCWRDVPVEFSGQVELRFEQPNFQKETELTDAAFDVIEFDGESIDLQQWLADQISVSVPDHPRCQNPCKIQLEKPEDDVEKPVTAVDPRWQQLQQIKLEN